MTQVNNPFPLWKQIRSRFSIPCSWWRSVAVTHRRNEDAAPSISPSAAMKYAFVLIWSLIPSNSFHGPFPYANTSRGKTKKELQEETYTSEDGLAHVLYEISLNSSASLPRCVSLQRSVFFLIETFFCSPTECQYLARNKVILRFQPKTERGIGTSRITRYICMPQGHILKETNA